MAGLRSANEATAAISGGKIRIVDVDPERFTDAEDEATAAGISGQQTNSGDVVYFGLIGTNESQLPILIAIDKGYFKSENLDVETGS